jgi:hypothetical protein
MLVVSAHGILFAKQNEQLIEESLRTGQSFAWRGEESSPAPEQVVWSRPRIAPQQPFRLTTAAPQNLAVDLLARTRTRARETRPQGRRVRSSSASRDGPLPPADDDPDLTPLQAGFLLLLEGLVAASAGGLPAYVEFLDLVRIRIAAESARLADWDGR